jgi:hypothetical protein
MVSRKEFDNKRLLNQLQLCPFGVPRETRGQNRPLVSFYDILKPALNTSSPAKTSFLPVPFFF